MYKKYKKYLIAASLAAVALASLAALVGYKKACQEQERAQEQALQARLQAQASQRRAEKQAVKKLIKVDIQKPFAQRFPAYRHSKRVYNQVTPKKRTARYNNYDSYDNLDSFTLTKPETKKTKSEPAAVSRTASSYNSPSSTYSSGNSTSYNSPSYSPPSSSMVSTPSWSGEPTGARAYTPKAHSGSQATPRAHAPSASTHEHVSHDSGSRTGGQSRPAQVSVAEPVKKEAQDKPVAKKEDKKDKKPEREFNPSPAKPKPERKPKREQVGEVNPTEPTLEDILKNYSSQENASAQEPEQDPNAQEPLTQPSFSDKFKAGVQSIVELLVTVSMVKNGWDYVKQACDWLESTFGIGKWVRSLVGSGPQAVPQVEPALQDQVAPPAEAQNGEQSADSSAPAPVVEERVASQAL